jgi:UDP-GlcNAc:undecaprenyl-phosphate/decaprenyl-phosphate GlcNAc-1-phosphate transferase
MLTPLLTAWSIAAVLSFAFCALVRRIGLRGLAIIEPRSDRWHSTATPTMGGVGFASAALLAAAAGTLWSTTLPTRAFEIVVPLAAVATLILGVFDDRLQLAPLAKLVFSLIIGAIIVFIITASFGRTVPLIATIFAVVWFGGVVHALNLLDNMDGLTGGIALIAIGMLSLLFAPVLGPFVVMYLVCVAGSLAGFIYWNWKPARLFMGDSGSLFLGGTLAAASLVALTAPGTDFYRSAVLILLVLSVPLFDTGFVLMLRRLAGRKATRGGTDHVSHRLVSLGFSERSAVRILYLIALSGGLIAMMIQQEGLQPILPVAVLFGVGLTLMGVYLARVRAYDAEDFGALKRSLFAPFLRHLTFRWHAGQVLLDLVLIAVCYYTAYRIRFEGETFSTFAPYLMGSLPAIMGCKLAALYFSGLYDRSWETFSLVDLFSVVRGVMAGTILSVLVVAYVYRFEGFSRAVFLIDAMLLVTAICGTRASFRVITDAASVRRRHATRVAIYGAGAGGHLLVREMRANRIWNSQPVVFLDDDPFKRNRLILGVPVRGTAADLDRLIRSQRIEELIISTQAVNGNVEKQIRSVCEDAGVPVRRLHLEIR